MHTHTPHHRSWRIRAGLFCVFLMTTFAATAADRQLLLIAGPNSHGPGEHRHEEGMKMFATELAAVKGLKVTVVTGGWPEDESLIQKADAIAIYADGLGGHPAIQNDRLAVLDKRIAAGMGLGLIHFAVHVPVGKGSDELKKWVGGYYESDFSCNPMWTPDFAKLPVHPITRGVNPFKQHDEWYFNMRFRENMEGVTPILIAKPSDETRDGPYVHPRGPYPHIQANKGRDEVMMWAVERKDGGRGFGFTGGHFHKGWDDTPKRRIVLNALIWISGLDVPEGGAPVSIAEAGK